MKKSRFPMRRVHSTKNIVRKGMLFGLLIFSMSLGHVFAQDAGPSADTGRGQEARRQVSQQPANRGVRTSPDPATDNLDHVAATTEQILEFLNKDAGLMVEFKKLLALDAGSAGQLLDESDLTDAAITERLNEDLRARVLATRLLQRYGYLLPKVNPDSELAAERTLVLQDRAYAMARAAERNSDSRTLPPATQTANCNPEISSDCDFPARGANRASSPLDGKEQQNPPAEQANPYEGYPSAPSRTDTPQSPRELRADLSASDTGETLLTSPPQSSLDVSANSANPRGRGNSQQGESVAFQRFQRICAFGAFAVRPARNSVRFALEPQQHRAQDLERRDFCVGRRGARARSHGAPPQSVC